LKKINKNILKRRRSILTILICFLILVLPATQTISVKILNGDLGVVHTYGDPEESGTIGVSRSDGTTVMYDYEAKPTCVKFENGNPQLGEDDPDTVGLIDTFIITFYGGALPISGEFKTGAGEVHFNINDVGELINISYYSTLTYTVTLVNITNDNNTFTFKVKSIAKLGNTAMSHIQFCFSDLTSTGN